ncbi:MAG: protein BatD [Rikenellaceae bacterium]|nr:protein BatD [Rikenellaceae bacterium]
MYGRIKTLLLTFAMAMCSLPALAQKGGITFEVAAPGAVQMGELFRIEFVVNAKPDKFDGPEFKGLDVMAGPSTSYSSSTSIVNGEITKSVSYTYTYVVQANSEGTATISEATVEVDDEKYMTRPQTIAVVDEGASAGGSPTTQSGAQQDAQRTQGGKQSTKGIGKDDIFVAVNLDKTRVYKGEPIRATIKLYTRTQLSGIENSKFPTFNGFWMQELKGVDYTWQSEAYNGKVYDTHILQEYLLFPQQVGRLQIEPFELTVVARIVTQPAGRQSMFDDFFGAMDVVQEVRKTLTSTRQMVEVLELPSGAPHSFAGAVGQFTLDATLPADQINANSSATYTVKVSGRGNLPLIQAPTLTLPTSFEQYNVKMTESLQSSSSGISGYRQFEYPFIARAEGEFTIPAVEFSYFNPRTAKYVTLNTREMTIRVEADSMACHTMSGIVSGLSKEEVKMLDKDIRFIKLGAAELSPKGRLFMWSPLYFILVAGLILVFVLAYLPLKRYINNMNNATFVRGKKANKVALQRLKAAQRYMTEGNERGFYDETLRALWGYMSDKLNIPVANLSKENIRGELTKRGFAEEQAQRFIELISECEMAQYSPLASGQMQEVYADSVKLLSKIESLKKI